MQNTLTWTSEEWTLATHMMGSLPAALSSSKAASTTFKASFSSPSSMRSRRMVEAGRPSCLQTSSIVS